MRSRAQAFMPMVAVSTLPLVERGEVRPVSASSSARIRKNRLASRRCGSTGSRSWKGLGVRRYEKGLRNWVPALKLLPNCMSARRAPLPRRGCGRHASASSRSCFPTDGRANLEACRSLSARRGPRPEKRRAVLPRTVWWNRPATDAFHLREERDGLLVITWQVIEIELPAQDQAARLRA